MPLPSSRRSVLLWALTCALVVLLGGSVAPPMRTAARAPLLTPTVTPTATPPPCPLGWNIVPSANEGALSNLLNGVAVIAPTDIWAVGAYQYAVLTEHWNGSAWTSVPNIYPGSNAVLRAVAAVATNDVWAVGYRHDSNISGPPPFTEHWDGSAWSFIPSAPITATDALLLGVTAVSATDVWAVGSYTGAGGNNQTLTEHWDGSVWTIIPSPNVGPGYNQFNGVAASGPANVWAVGSFVDANGLYRTLTARWDGSAWTVVPSPNVGTDGLNFFNAVAVAGPADAWAVGSYGGTDTLTLTEHWDGSAWTVVASPNPGSARNFFTAVAIAGPADVWAVGSYSNNSFGDRQSLTAHWDGNAWSNVPSPPPAANTSDLRGVAVVGPADVWAVGSYFDNTQRTLTQRYNCLLPTSTPTLTVPPTPTTTPTNTALPPSATGTSVPPSATATVCPVRFSDVTDPTAYYYAGVYALACRGVLSGYSDGTFRPFSLTTRAQMTKIVILAFNIALVTPPALANRTFTDVLPDNVFYQLIETAAARSIVSGYTCGGSNPQTGQAEPCDSANRPYFRPSNFVTRGQLTKIVVIGAGFTLINPPTPTFTDVDRANVFYPFIETAVCHGAISGYSDGTFRPNNFAFRGQIAKIVYNAVTAPQSCAQPTVTATPNVTPGVR